jgi:hypothetical protein
MPPDHFEPGTSVALRYITRDGAPGMSWPYRVIQDSDELVALFIPRGANVKGWSGSGPDRRLEDIRWRSETLRLMFPGAQHSIWLFWGHYSDDRAFSGYYVNMEEPFRRTAIGFDTNDHMLDITVAPDLGWRWKDEDHLAERVVSGIYSEEFARSVREEGERVIEKIEGRASPFCDGWEAFTPDPSWPLPELPAGWDTVPAMLWERRLWAYAHLNRA